MSRLAPPVSRPRSADRDAQDLTDAGSHGADGHVDAVVDLPSTSRGSRARNDGPTPEHVASENMVERPRRIVRRRRCRACPVIGAVMR